jgi:hypothetical protein
MDLTRRHPFQREIGNNRTLRHFLMYLNVQVTHLVCQKNRQAWLLFLCPAAENPRSTLSEQVSESAEIWIRSPIRVPRYYIKVKHPIFYDKNFRLNPTGTEMLRVELNTM